MEKLRFALLGLFILAQPVYAVQSVNLRNDREGESFYNGFSQKRDLNRALKQVDSTQMMAAFDDALRSENASKLCTFDINKTLKRNLQAINPKFDEMNGALYFLRSINEIDDMVVKLLMAAHTLTTTRISYAKDAKNLFLPNHATTTELLKIISEFKTTFLKNECFDAAYRSMLSQLKKTDKMLKDSHFEALLYKAYKDRFIDQDTYSMLEKARENKLESNLISLKSYNQKITSLRARFPLRDPHEHSAFVTQKVEKMKVSRRQRLLENYSDLQIMIMGQVIKKLRSRLESPKVEILIYDREQASETILLEPMERFRLAIKLLRKEMSLISSNSIFEGRSPDYFDLMTAAYEIGIIPASELDELAGLQDIWNPKKTFWEKARVWVGAFSTIATIVIPPPYGFIPALVIIVIEATTGHKNDPNTEDPTSLF